MLYLFSVVYFILQWYVLDLMLVQNSSTGDSVLLASQEGPSWFDPVVVSLSDFSLVVSDALLVR